MVCASEGQEELGAALRAQAHVTTPTWVDHLYGCTYEYPDGSFALSVKELPTLASTVEYFVSLREQHTGSESLGLGEESFLSVDDTAFVRKDNKVLTVDVSNLPAQFSAPPLSHRDASLLIAFTILGCWTGE
jgi:hypothetical protein